MNNLEDTLQSRRAKRIGYDEELSIEITDQHDVVLPFATSDGQKSAVKRVAEVEKLVSSEVHDFRRQTAVQVLFDKDSRTGAFNSVNQRLPVRRPLNPVL